MPWGRSVCGNLVLLPDFRRPPRSSPKTMCVLCVLAIDNAPIWCYTPAVGISWAKSGRQTPLLSKVTALGGGGEVCAFGGFPKCSATGPAAHFIYHNGDG